MDEQEMRLWIEDALNTYEQDHEAKRIHSFEAAGIMTRNEGLVVRMEDGSEFQITIVKSK